VILLFGNAVQVFSLVLTAFLIGTGLSALIGTKLLNTVKKTEYLFSGAFILSGIFVILSPIMLAGLPYLPFSWALGAKGFQFMILGVVLLPVLLSGCLVPITIKLFQIDNNFNSTYQASKVYAISTAGAVFGAALTNYYLIPLLGTDGVLSFIAINSVAIGLVFFWIENKSDKKIHLTLACLFICLLIIVKLPGKINEIYVSAMTNQEGHDSDKKLFYEGRAVTVAILDSYNNSRRLFLNGVEEVSTRYNHIQLFKTLGMLPIFVNESDDASDVMMIGFGAGITASAAMDTGMVRSLDVVDINPDIEKINELYKEANNDIYNNPKFNFINEDGRNYLFLNPKKYNVIISDSTHPFAYDSWVLYTIEFYNEVKEHLDPGGVFVQWIPLNVPKDYLKVFLKTFIQVFPNSTFWNIPGSDQSFVIATEEPLSIDINRLQSQLNNMPSRTKLREYELSSAINILSFFMLDTEAIDRLVSSEKKISTDDNPYTFRSVYEADRSGNKPASLADLQVSVVPYVKNLTVNDKLRIANRQALSKLLHRFFVSNDLFAMQIAYEMAPQDMSVLYYMGYDPLIYTWDNYLFSSSENAVSLQKVEPGEQIPLR
ncbi:MAG: fused MFS/spermidine synthase, partial [Candidatus Omnitrophica bacterium]|nr:fused MFS/spermidine synthase [Candidatus Omnitrophota bacterium]